jgi:hypothetical protein
MNGSEATLIARIDEMTPKSEIQRLRSAFLKVLFVCSLMCLTSCVDDRRYHVFLVVDAKNYRPEMTWDEIRERGFKMPDTVRVFDSKGNSIQLFRFNHDDGGITPLDSNEVHISTPLIIEKKNDIVDLLLLSHGQLKAKTRVMMRDLKSVKGVPNGSVILINLSQR